MLKVVIDTNCLIQALPPKSSAHWLYQGMKQGKFVVVVTTSILEEYEEIVAEFYTPEIADFALKVITNLPNVEKSTINFRWNLISVDPDDNKFVDCALNSGADVIVTEDKHFNVLTKIKFPRIQHENLSTFKKRLTTLGLLPK